MIEDINNVINELKILLKNKYSDFLGLYLYGSYAKGTAKKNSDIDIVALFKDEITKEKRYSIYDILMEIEYKLDVLFDFHPMTTNELKSNPVFFDEVTNKGIYYAGS